MRSLETWGGTRVLRVSDRDEGLGVTFPSGQESQSF